MELSVSNYREKRDFEKRLEQTLLRIQPKIPAFPEDKQNFWKRGMQMLQKLRQSGALEWKRTRGEYLNYLKKAKDLETRVKTD